MHFVRSAALLPAALFIGCGAVRADALGGLDGRSADSSGMPAVSAEVSYVEDDEVSVLSLRTSFRVADTTTGFATLGLTEYDDSGADGYVLGAGLYYQFDRQRLSPAVDLAIKPSAGYLGAEGNGAEVDGFVAALELLVSGTEPIGAFGWYGTLGMEFSYIDTNNNGNDGDFDGLLGTGTYVPLGPGQLYAGFDYSGELGYGAGYRYHF